MSVDNPELTMLLERPYRRRWLLRANRLLTNADKRVDSRQHTTDAASAYLPMKHHAAGATTSRGRSSAVLNPAAPEANPSALDADMKQMAEQCELVHTLLICPLWRSG